MNSLPRSGVAICGPNSELTCACGCAKGVSPLPTMPPSSPPPPLLPAAPGCEPSTLPTPRQLSAYTEAPREMVVTLHCVMRLYCKVARIRGDYAASHMRATGATTIQISM